MDTYCALELLVLLASLVASEIESRNDRNRRISFAFLRAQYLVDKMMVNYYERWSWRSIIDAGQWFLCIVLCVAASASKAFIPIIEIEGGEGEKSIRLDEKNILCRSNSVGSCAVWCIRFEGHGE